MTDATPAQLALAPPAALDTIAGTVRELAIVTPTDAETFARGASTLRAIATAKDQVEKEKRSGLALVKQLDAKIRGWFRPLEERLAELEGGQRRALSRYTEEQRLREEAQRREAEARARAERERLQAEARAAEEKARREAEEKRRKAEEEREAGNVAAAAKLEAQAAGVEQRAEARADNLLARAETVVAEPVKTAAPKVKGLSERKVWKFEITDASKIRPEFLTPDETKIGKQVRALGKDAAPLIGEGVRIWQETEHSARKQS